MDATTERSNKNASPLVGTFNVLSPQNPRHGDQCGGAAKLRCLVSGIYSPNFLRSFFSAVELYIGRYVAELLQTDAACFWADVNACFIPLYFLLLMVPASNECNEVLCCLIPCGTDISALTPVSAITLHAMSYVGA